MENKAINTLLEVLHIIEHDGLYSDSEALIQVLTALGVSEEIIAYHLKKTEHQD